MTENKFAPQSALICDDVRKETSGKDIIIGVYADTVYINIIPSNLSVALYIKTRIISKETFKLAFKIIGPNGLQITPDMPLSLPGQPDAEAVASIVIGGIVFQAQMEGRYQFQWQPPRQEWETIATLNVRKGTMPPLSLTSISAPTGALPQSAQSQPDAQA